jgi:hypothetical protein
MNIKGMFRTPSLYVFNQTDAAPQTLLQKKMELREHLKGAPKMQSFCGALHGGVCGAVPNMP